MLTGREGGGGGGWGAEGFMGTVATGVREQTPQAAPRLGGGRLGHPAGRRSLFGEDLAHGPTWEAGGGCFPPLPTLPRRVKSAARPGGPAVGDEDCASAPQSAVRGPGAGGRRCRSGSSFQVRQRGERRGPRSGR